jgi:hypothetical protein
MKATPIPINLICIAGDSQCRANTDRDTVEEYAHAWRADADFPPVDLFTQGTVYFPGDGMHRILAAKRAGRAAILAYVLRGDARDAFLHGCASNQTHGLRRTNADKRHMVCRMLNDSEWVKWSDRLIAEKCGVSAQFVSNVRGELSTVDSSPACRQADNPRLGADGKLRRQPAIGQTKKCGRTIEPNRTSPIALANVSSDARSPSNGRIDRRSPRKQAIELLDQLEDLLISIDLYDCCAQELRAISEQIKMQNSAVISA